MLISPNINGTTVFIACLGSGNDAYRWLDGLTPSGGVRLTYRLPSHGAKFTGTLWYPELIPHTTNIYSFKTLGSDENPDKVYLDGSPSGLVALDSDNSAKSARWILEQGSTKPWYPHQPWNKPKINYTFTLKNMHTNSYLNGYTVDGNVKLYSGTPDDSHSGVYWLILIAAHSQVVTSEK